jgi:TonB family protein
LSKGGDRTLSIKACRFLEGGGGMAEDSGVIRRVSEHRMFETLIASRPVRERRDGAAAVAVTLHVGVIAAVAWLSLAGNSALEPPPEATDRVTLYELVKPEDSKAKAEAAAAAERVRQVQMALEQRAEEEAEARRLLVLNPPEIEPTTIPEPALVPFVTLRPEDLEGIELGVSTVALLNEHIELTAEQLASQLPEFTQHTDGPELVNIDEVRRELRHEYPIFLQDAGVGGRVLLWFLIDETGGVRKWQLKASSGFGDLDGAALKAAARMRFRPARNYDHSVAVWVVVPILFQPGEVGFAS